MSEGHGRDTWQRASLLMALIANVNRDSKKHRPFKPEDFSPYKTERSRKVATKSDLASLRSKMKIRTTKVKAGGIK